jgi:DNA-binding transcriptional regulator YiaG
MNKKQYRSDALKAVHTMMQDLQQAGLVDKGTMRRFDASCLQERGLCRDMPEAPGTKRKSAKKPL